MKRIFFKIFNLKKYPYYLNILWSRFFITNVLGTKISIGPDVHFYGMPIVTAYPGSRITIGGKSVLCSNSKNTSLGVNHPVVLRTLSKNANIKIGSNTGISGATICAISSVTIGDYCLLGANVMIVDNDFHPIESRTNRHTSSPEALFSSPIHISRNVFIGAGSIILKGVTIGENSVIGAGSVVAKDVPPNSIAAGNPAKYIKSF